MFTDSINEIIGMLNTCIVIMTKDSCINTYYDWKLIFSNASSAWFLWDWLWSPYVIGHDHYIFILFMAALWNRGAIIFLPCGYYLSFYLFFPRLISAAGDWVSTILPHMVWPQCEFRMHVWNVRYAARCKYRTQKKSPKIAIWEPLHNFVGLYLRN